MPAYSSLLAGSSSVDIHIKPLTMSPQFHLYQKGRYNVGRISVPLWRFKRMSRNGRLGRPGDGTDIARVGVLGWRQATLALRTAGLGEWKPSERRCGIIWDASTQKQ